MTTSWRIGKKAKELDSQSISNRLKVGKRTLIKLMWSIGIYLGIMGVMYFFLSF